MTCEARGAELGSERANPRQITLRKGLLDGDEEGVADALVVDYRHEPNSRRDPEKGWWPSDWALRSWFLRLA